MGRLLAFTVAAVAAVATAPTAAAVAAGEKVAVVAAGQIVGVVAAGGAPRHESYPHLDGRQPAVAIAGDRIIVRLRAAAGLPALANRLNGSGVEVETVVTNDPLRVLLRVGREALRTETPGVQHVASALYASGLVDYAVPEIWWPMDLRSRRVPNDPLFAEQWHLENTGQGGRVADADVDAADAWRYTRGSPEIVIAVLDDGVQLDHPDLAPNLLNTGRDFTASPPDGDARPRTNGDRHGTSVAGIAAARGDNGLGIAGICPQCTILPLRVHKSSNIATAAAFRYAVEQGADIITNSWGYTREMPFAADDAVRDAIDEAARSGREGRGALVVFAVTNESVDNCEGPATDIASLDSVLAVGVANHNDRVGGSGFGDCLDLVAPSKPRDRTTIGIVTTDRTGLDGHSPGDYDTRFGGTSAAAPLVAGIAGLLLSLNPELSRSDLQRILEHTAEKIDPANADYDARGFSRKAGYGRVNAARALVPTVKIEVAPERVAAGEPFSVSVTASAPFGLDSLSWFGLGTGIAALDEPRRQAVAGEAVGTVTWEGIVIDRPGTFTLGADAADRRHAAAPAGDPARYPHRAADADRIATAVVTVL